MSRLDETCSREGCSSVQHAKGLCHLHYRAELRESRPTSPCGCGCGGQTRYRFLHGHHTRLFTPEEQSRRSSSPNNGASKRDKGSADWYRKVDYRHEHRVVMEKFLGRPLRPDEVIHHKDHNKKNNAITNLELMTRAEHMHEHRKQLAEGRKRKHGY